MSISIYKSLRYALGAAAVATVLAVGSPAVFAAPQTAAPPPANPQQPPILSVNDKQNYLHLTAAQQKQMIAIVSKAQKEHDMLETDKTMTSEQKQAKWYAFIKTTQDQMKALLSPAQRQISAQHAAEAAKYQAGIQDLQKKAQIVSQQLKDSMTAAQNKSMQAAAASANAQLATIRANKSLTPQQQAEQLQTLNTTLNKTMTSILTPKQQALVDQLKSYQEEAVNLQKLAMSQ